MKVLVANLGSTSFKYRLFDMRDERQLARGGTERIGNPHSRTFVDIGGRKRESSQPVADHAVAVEACFEQLTDATDGCLRSADEIAAIGFKAVHAGKITGAVRVTPEVLSAMDEMHDVAPAHNPPYVGAMRLIAERLPKIALVAAFETAFHSTIPGRNRHYAIPHDWATEHGVLRYGFHGASHRYIAERTADLVGRSDLRIISCHLGGSSSLCAIRAGTSVATSMGMSPQSGLPHNNRVGDFDSFSLPLLARKTGKTTDALLADLANRGGLLGVSGTSGDLRDLEQAALQGDDRAQLAIDVFIGAVRHYLGAYLVELGGADCIVFTGGIGENSITTRAAVCANLESLGIQIDRTANEAARGEARISTDASRVAVWVVPTNEELIVARQTKAVIEG